MGMWIRCMPGMITLAIDGRAILWTENPAGTWPSLAGGATFFVRALDFEKALTVVSAVSAETGGAGSDGRGDGGAAGDSLHPGGRRACAGA